MMHIQSKKNGVDCECLNERFVLTQIFAKSRNERPQPGVRHVWDQLIKHAALPEQRMGSVFGGIDLDVTRQSGWKRCGEQDGQFGGRGEEMIVAARQ